MLIRDADLSSGAGVVRIGDGCSTGSGGAGGGAVGIVGGTVVHAAKRSADKANPRRKQLVTEPDTHDIDFGCPEAASCHVEFVKIFDGSDIDSEIVAIVNSRTLHTRFNTV